MDWFLYKNGFHHEGVNSNWLKRNFLFNSVVAFNLLDTMMGFIFITYISQLIFSIFCFTVYPNSWILDASVGRQALNAGIWTTGAGLRRLDSGSWTLDSKRWTLDSGHLTLDAKPRRPDYGRRNLDAGRYTLDTELLTLDTVVDCFRTESEPSF